MIDYNQTVRTGTQPEPYGQHLAFLGPGLGLVHTDFLNTPIQVFQPKNNWFTKVFLTRSQNLIDPVLAQWTIDL